MGTSLKEDYEKVAGLVAHNMAKYILEGNLGDRDKGILREYLFIKLMATFEHGYQKRWNLAEIKSEWKKYFENKEINKL